MPILDCRPYIKTLLRKANALTLSGNLTTTATEEMPNPFDYTMLYFRLGENLARLYMDALNRLRWELHPQHAAELHPQHAAEPEVIKGFWALFTQVTSDMATFSDKSILNRRLEEFGAEFKRPLEDFDVAYAIKFMDIGIDRISIGSVTFVGPNDQSESNWATGTTWWPKDDPSHPGLISAVYTRVSASDSD